MYLQYANTYIDMKGITVCLYLVYIMVIPKKIQKVFRFL